MSQTRGAPDDCRGPRSHSDADHQRLCPQRAHNSNVHPADYPEGEFSSPHEIPTPRLTFGMHF